jgi:Ankyrin repeats (3 copies)
MQRTSLTTASRGVKICSKYSYLAGLLRCRAGNLPLHDALGRYKPSADSVRFLLEAYPLAVHVWGSRGRLPLHAAAEHESFPAVEDIADEWPDAIVEQSRDGRHNPVHLVAARGGSSNLDPTLGILRHLVSLRPDALRQQTSDGYTPLHVALEKGAHLDIIRFLVSQERRALEVWTGSGYLPLHLAAIHGVDLETLTLLADEYPEAVRAECRSGHAGTVLHAVTAGGFPSPAAIRLCVRHWPNSVCALNHEGRAPIHVAVSSSFMSCSRLLRAAVRLLAGPAPDTLRIRDAHGHIPLHILLLRKDPPVAVVRCLVHMCPRSVLLPTWEEPKQYPVCLAAANPDVSLDVLYYLVQHSLAHFFLRGRT